MEPEPEPQDVQVEAAKMALERRGNRVSLYGQPFRPESAGRFMPRTLTVWLPKGMSLLGPKTKTCTKAQARGLTIDTDERCPPVASGRLNAENDLRAWFAYPGPKQGNKRPVWLRTRKDGTKLVLRYGGLNIRTTFMEVGIGGLRETGKCPSGGWRFKVKVEAAGGADSVTFRGKCAKGGKPKG